MHVDQIQTSVAVESGSIAVTISGNAESSTADQLESLFGDVHSKATPDQVVIVDLRALRFMTSSCLRVFANWVIQVSQAQPPYKIRLLSSNEHSWQRRSLGALASVANGVVKVNAT